MADRVHRPVARVGIRTAVLTAAAVLALALTGCTSSSTASTTSSSAPAVTQPTPAAVSSAAPAAVAPESSEVWPAGSSPASPASPVPQSSAAATSPATSPAAVPTSQPSGARLAVTPKPAPSSVAKAPSRPAATPALLVNQLASRGGAQQVVTVTSTSWTSDVGTLQTFQLVSGSWRAEFGAMPVHLGRAGFSADKHEGDDKTPTGLFGFATMFGQHQNPGVKFSYRVPDAQSVWVDDPTSRYYNTWQENASLKGEHLASSGYASTYGYAVDIAYNTDPVVPGRGSAIFLHVSDGNGTAGCVSLPQTDLLEVLRWLDPTKHPVIVMAPTSAIQEY